MKPLMNWKVWNAANESDCLLELCDKDGARHYLHLTEGAAYALGTQLVEKASQTYRARHDEVAA